MPRKKSEKKRKKIGIEALVEPGVGALYVRGTWMKKLDELNNNKREKKKKSRSKRK